MLVAMLFSMCAKMSPKLAAKMVMLVLVFAYICPACAIGTLGPL